MSVKLFEGRDPLFFRAVALADEGRDKSACKAPILATRRQWLKWRRHMGMAYRYRDEAKLDLEALTK